MSDNLMIPQTIAEANILDEPAGAPLELGSPANPEQKLNTFHEDFPIPSNKPNNPADASDDYLKEHSGPAAATTFDYVAQRPPQPFQDRVPANWDLSAVGDQVTAVNHVSGESFEGSRQTFNDMLRGR